MIYDVVGIGFGPSNIALEVSMEEHGYAGTRIFLEKKDQSHWHPDMLLEGSDIQNHPLRDFVTPVNPRSKYTFINYLHEEGRLFDFLNLGVVHPLRGDFYKYILWVAKQLGNVRYRCDVRGLEKVEIHGEALWQVELSDGEKVLGRKVVLGTGRRLNIPPIAGIEDNPRCIHFTRYLRQIESLDKSAEIVVLGASQSAVEILLDLTNKGFRNVAAVHRSFSFRLKDTSPFSDEVYFPEFVDYYHSLPPARRHQLDGQVRQTNYSCADRDIVDQLYLKIYEGRLQGRRALKVVRNHEIMEARDRELKIRDVYTGEAAWIPFDLLIMATGFLDVGRDGRNGLPEILKNLAGCFAWDGGYLRVGRDYRVEYRSSSADMPDLYLNGLCESSHGLGDAGSFSLVSIRARDILRSVIRKVESHPNPGPELVPAAC